MVAQGSHRPPSLKWVPAEDWQLQGDPSCEYCSISREDVKATLGISSTHAFGSCVLLPCFSYLASTQSPTLCQHYVQAPSDVTVQFVANQDPRHDAVIISWRPSVYGISFLRGFQVSLQALGGLRVDCQLLLFQRNLSLSAAHAQRVYQSRPFSQLALGSQFAVTVMAIPVPELWGDFYRSKTFSTRTCPEKNGLEQCQRDWYPEHVEVQQEGDAITVTFNLAPPLLSISRYFSWCYGGGVQNFTPIQVNPAGNRTHLTFHLLGLRLETNYSCELAADVVDAVRRRFTVRLSQVQPDPPQSSAETVALYLLLPAALLLTVLVALVLGTASRRKKKKRLRKLKEAEGVCVDLAQEEHRVVSPGTARPPRLLLLRSGADGPAHDRLVLQLATFLQQHLAVQVSLDLWEAFALAEEGSMSWYCQRIQDSDFVLVICTERLGQQLSGWGRQAVRAEPGKGASALAAVSLVGEQLGRARATGQNLSKFLTATFQYSRGVEVPGLLGLASHYTLMRDLPLLFSHLHQVVLHSPGRQLHVEHISEEAYLKLPAGAALLRAVSEAETEDQRGRQLHS
ncbi:interleukin-17 receptor D-like isoform X3 [Arapaima gigas]